MEIFEKMNFKVKPVLKISGLVILGLVIGYIIFVLLGSLFGTFSGKSHSNYGYSGSVAVNSKSVLAPMMAGSGSGGSLGLSQRNAASSMGESYSMDSTVSTGNQAENFEVTQYNATIETRQFDKACAAIGGLKSREDVIFENASEYADGCNYTFKVNKDKTNEILALLKGMKPKELSGNTYTIQGQVSDYTGEIDILEKKLAAIDDTLGKAVSAYDQVAQVATGAKDVESLAKVIDSKINTIERLTQERIDINSQLDQIQRSKDQQVDRLNYTYFYVGVSNGGFVDWRNLKDSWNAAVKESVNKINQTIQNISINLIGFLFTLLQYAAYALVPLFLAKYGWRLTKHIWQK